MLQSSSSRWKWPALQDDSEKKQRKHNANMSDDSHAGGDKLAKTSDVAFVRLEVVTTQIVVAQLRTSHIRAVGILGNVVMKCM